MDPWRTCNSESWTVCGIAPRRSISFCAAWNHIWFIFGSRSDCSPWSPRDALYSFRSHRIAHRNSFLWDHVESCSPFLFLWLSFAMETKKLTILSMVEVVRRRLNQLFAEEWGISGPIKRWTVENRSCMQWWVDRNICVSSKGALRRIDCCLSIEDAIFLWRWPEWSESESEDADDSKKNTA